MRNMDLLMGRIVSNLLTACSIAPCAQLRETEKRPMIDWHEPSSIVLVHDSEIKRE